MTTEPSPPDPRTVRRPGDGWVDCRCGQRHWGRHGAAGLLLWSPEPPPSAGASSAGVLSAELERFAVVAPSDARTRHPTLGVGESGDEGSGGDTGDERVGEGARDAAPPWRLVLQHRAHWSHFGGTWGLPGGAVDPEETAVEGALREAVEEAGIDPSAVAVRATYLLDHGDWSYTTVVAEAVAPTEPVVSDPESLEVAWVAAESIGAHELLPAFADAWPELREIAGRRSVLVVDAANTVGSRPDGWWRDRAGATERLRSELAALAEAGLPAAALGMPGHVWFPQIVLVTEGAARDVGPEPGVRVVPASGSGDDEILAQARLAMAGGADVVVVTADRELRRRVTDAGARTAGPSLVLDRTTR